MARSGFEPLLQQHRALIARPWRVMYAVIETGGKQYRVELGTELAVERIATHPGETVQFDQVLLVADGATAHIGTPTVADAQVMADVVRQDRGDKVVVFKYRPKARHRAKKGHRQELTVIRVADIRFGGRSAAEEAGVQEKEQAKARRAAEAEAKRRSEADKALADKLAREAAERAEQAEAKKAARTTRSRAKAKAQASEVATDARTAAEPGAEAEAKQAAAEGKTTRPRRASTGATSTSRPARRSTSKKDD
jgi:large subunit ribosomal protein L21